MADNENNVDEDYQEFTAKLDDDGRSFVIGIHSNQVSANMTMEADTASQLATKFLQMADRSASVTGKRVTQKDVEAMNPETVNTNGFSVSPTNDPSKVALKILVGAQVIAFSIPVEGLASIARTLQEVADSVNAS